MTRPRSSENDTSYRQLMSESVNSAKVPFLQHSPYSRPLRTAVNASIDKSTLLWRDFITAVQRRKRLINHIRLVASSENDMSDTLKRLFLDLRQLTLKLIEDALEIEYRSQFGEISSQPFKGVMQLPPLASFRGLDGKEDVLMLSDIIHDIDDLYRLPNIKAFLPLSFPLSRNPFMLGKNVDDLAAMPNPPLEAANLANELKALELLRYKRASKTLLKAEAQVLNKMPLSLEDVQHMWKLMEKNTNMNTLVRVVLTMLDEDNVSHSKNGPQLRYLVDTSIHMEPYQFLRKLTNFNDRTEFSVDVIASIKHVLKSVKSSSFTDISSSFLCEWVRALLGGNIFYGEGLSSEGGLLSSQLAFKTRSGYVSPAQKHLASSTLPSTGHASGSNSQEVTRAGRGKKDIGLSSADDLSTSHVSENTSHKDKSYSVEAMNESPAKVVKAKKVKNISSHQMTERERRQKIESAINGGQKGGGRDGEAATQKGNKGNTSNADGEGVSADSFNALKYELIRMQKELLRRKVLDPKHFLHAMSATGVYTSEEPGPEKRLENFDASSNKLKTLKAAGAKTNDKSRGAGYSALSSSSAKTPMTDTLSNEVTDLAVLNMQLILHESLPLKEIQVGWISIYVDSFKENVYVQYKFQPPPPPPPPLEHDTESQHEPQHRVFVGSVIGNNEEIIGFVPINRLYFDKLFGLQLENLVQVPEKLRRSQLSPFLLAIKNRIDQMLQYGVTPELLRFHVDLRLVSNVLRSGSSAVNIVVERSLENDGIVLLAMSGDEKISNKRKSMSTLSLFIHDKELLVLLINQRGLYTLAMSKWSCMEMIANWILSRTSVNRVLVEETTGIPTTNFKLDAKIEDTSKGAEQHDGTVATRSNASFFEIAVDRSVDIGEDVLQVWKVKNISMLNEVTLKVEVMARQDLEMLCFDIRIVLVYLPLDIKLRRQKEYEENRAHNAKVIVFTSPYDDAYVKHNPNAAREPIEYPDETKKHSFTMSFGLTGSELLIFGSGETLESNRTIPQSKLPTSFNPATFMKNVINRLHVTFEGNTAEPLNSACICTATENWTIKYNRRLLRDVRTISGGVMVVVVSAIGSELLYEAKPTDFSIFTEISAKLFETSELEDIVKSEGWSPDILDPGNRVMLAFRVLENLKVIADKNEITKKRLEFYTFPETRLLEVHLLGTINKDLDVLGNVEISTFHTLTDLRLIISNELDSDLVPKQYRFLYKTTPCSLKQEPYRKAWECLPTIIIASKTDRELNRGNDNLSPDKLKELIKAKEMKKKKENDEDLAKNRSLSKKLVPIPIPTLVYVRTGEWKIYTRHDMRGLLQPGDILRIGHHQSSDFVIPLSFGRILGITLPDDDYDAISNNSESIYGFDDTIKKVPIDPCFYTYKEEHMFLYGNYPNIDVTEMDDVMSHASTDGGNASKKAKQNSRKASTAVTSDTKKDTRKVSVMPDQTLARDSKKDTRKVSVMPDQTVARDTKKDTRKVSIMSEITNVNEMDVEDGMSMHSEINMDLFNDAATNGMPQFRYIVSSDVQASGDAGETRAACKNVNSAEEVKTRENRDDAEELKEAVARTDHISGKGERFLDLWLWKCIPRAEDRRPKWRIMYDNGQVPYKFVYKTRKDGLKNFRVIAPWRVLEVLCRDHRCPDMSSYAQRVYEMPNISIQFYTKLAYDKMLKWSVANGEGVSQEKIIKLLDNIDLFPDLKKPSRLAQLDGVFTKEASGDNGNDFAINYLGFCNMLQELSIIRFPQGILDLNNIISESSGAMDGNYKSSDMDAPLVCDIEYQGSLPTEKNPNRLGKTESQATQIGDVMKSPSSDANAKDLKKKDPKKKKLKLAKNMEATLWSTVDPKHAVTAYRKVVVDYIGCHAEWSELIWERAKVFAMKKEAIKYSAATRIGCSIRGHLAYRKFRIFVRGMILFQSYVRRKFHRRGVQALIKIYHEDWLFRLRYNCAILVQSSVRRYLGRCWYLKTTKKLKEKAIVLMKTKRMKLSKIREKERKTIVFKQIRRINGIVVLLVIKRKDQRPYSTDYGMKLFVYTPDWQEMLSFVIEEKQLRIFLSELLQTTALSIGDILNKNNLENIITTRLLCKKSRNPKSAPKIILTRQALGQKGPEVLTKGRYIDKEFFVCTLYETKYEISVSCYHPHTCRLFMCNIIQSAIATWVTELHVASHKNDIQKQQTTPPLLKAENKAKLLVWLLDQIVVDKRHGKFQVLFACQLQKSKKLEGIIYLQALWRRAIVRSKVPIWLDSHYLKVMSGPHDSSHYYLNKYTGVSSWEKPPMLHNADIPTNPEYKWISLPYSTDHSLYVNPMTGKYTHLTMFRASRIMQALVRSWLLKPFRLPKDTFQKAAKLNLDAPKNYNQDKARLSYIINFALHEFCVSLDFKSSKRLILAALELADTNPLTTRLYAILLLSSVEAPQAVTREKAFQLLKDAERRDKTIAKFEVSRDCFFKYGCYKAPRNSQALLNMALVEYYIFKNLPIAEILMRRAISISPFQQNVMINWKMLRDQFPERKLVYRSKGKQERLTSLENGKKLTIHGRPVIDHPSYAGWVFAERDETFTNDEAAFWYNPATGERRYKAPEDFQYEWQLRAARSHFEGEKDGIEFYYDSATGHHFQRHVLSDSYSI